MAQVTASGPLGDSNELFEKAKDSFLAVLSPIERATFTSTTPDVVIQEAKEITERFKDQSRSFRMYAQVSAFGEAIRPYFEVLGILVSARPEWAAIAWGALRLILQLASNYTSFFEKLAGLLAELARLAPRFKDVVELVGHSSNASCRVKAAIQGFYADLFALYQAVAIVFTKKSGELKKTYQVIGRIMWTPFESKFQNIVSRVEHHRRTIEDELQILALKKFVDVQSSLSHQLQSTAEIKDDIHNQICSIGDLQQAIHTVNEAVRTQGQTLERQLLEYRQLLEANNSRLAHSLSDMMRFLDPPREFVQELEDAHLLRHPGSGMWIFFDQEFMEWSQSHDAATLWIKGKPGCGKSILAGSIINDLPDRREAAQGERPQIFYFFFSVRKPTLQSTDGACRALLSQILNRYYSEERILSAFDYAMSQRKDGQISATSGVIWDLLVMALELLPGSFLILDGIDECVIPNAIDNHEQDDHLVKFLDNLQSDLQGSRSKILLLSRPSMRRMSPLITKHRMRTIHITSEMNSGDLRLYCTTGLRNLVSEGLLLSQTPEGFGKLVDTLLVGADGMFLWARLMFSYLKSPYLAPDPSFAASLRLNYINSLRYPETLDTMYTRILNLIYRFDKPLRNQARTVFCWLLFPKRHHLAAVELHDILIVTSFDRHVDDEAMGLVPNFEYQPNFRYMDESIISACCSLVESSKDVGGPFYRFIHGSAVDYFRKRFQLYDSSADFPQGGGFIHQKTFEPGVYPFFFLCPTEVEMQLTMACITYFRRRITPGPLSGNILQTAGKTHVAEKYPFLAYASSFWTAHLRQTRPACSHRTYSNNVRRLKENLSAFLEARITMMTWVEAMYLLGRPVDIYQHGPNISDWISIDESVPGIGLDVCACLGDLCHDLEKLEEEWGNALREAPDHIWNDITAFFDSKFFVKTSATKVMSLAPEIVAAPSQSSKALSSISASDTTDSFMAILSIWPSRDFELTWHLVSDTRNAQQLISASQGWVAQYELYNTAGDMPNATMNYTVPLDADEVCQQLRHFLQRSPVTKSTSGAAGAGYTMKKLTVSFPTAISCYDLGVFTILRTVYKISTLPTPVNNLDLQSFLIPLDFNENMKAIWGNDTVAATSHAATNKTYADLGTKKVTYTYNFEFSYGNKYLLYYDTAGMSILPHGNMKLATTLAIFQLPQQTSWSGSPVRFLSQIESKPNEQYYSSWAIHPELPIVAISCRSVNRSPITLWDFEDTSQLRIENPACLSMPGTVSNMSFSECGKSLVIQRFGFPHPSIRSIEKCTCFKRRQKKRQSHQQAQPTHSLVHRTTKVGDIVAYDAGSLRSGQMQHFISPDGRQSTQHLQVAVGGVTGIELTQSRNGPNGNMTTRQPIVALPSIESVHHLQVNMQVPQSKEEPIKLIVNKSTQPHYSLDDEQDQHFPAMITKNQKALRASTGKRELDALSEAEESGNSTKKIKHCPDASWGL